MKSIIPTLCYIAIATALVIPSSNKQVPLVHSKVALLEASPQDIPLPGIGLADKKDPEVLEELPIISCFCTGGTLCCERDGKADCSFGLCGMGI